MIHPGDSRLDWSQRLNNLEHHFCQLWDEVWWSQLPWYKRLYYWLKGYRSPIQNFYDEE